MDGERARLAQEILERVIELDAAQREGYIHEVAAGDEALEVEVRSLLAAHEQAAMFLETPALAVQAAGVLAPGARIGRYSVQSVLGVGGMGTVYLATQSDPKRSVALKLMHRGLVSRSALLRFRHEAQILARLEHPGIARVYEAGTHDDGAGGLPWFALEYIEGGRPLTEHVVRERLSIEQRLELFAKVCDAVHHGHQKGIIHRDLKPANILVNRAGEPRIIDFGVARATDADVRLTSMHTNAGQLIGTLQYMSPEQCDADPGNLDIRSDVYTLGLVLFELLCDRPPFDASRHALLEVAQIIREKPPPRPSSIKAVLRGDLETITLRALAKDRERRYPSAAALADDLRRFIDHEPIEARAPTLLYQLGLFARRHRRVVAAAVVAVLALVAATIISIVFAVQAGREARSRTEAEHQLRIALAEAQRQAYAARISAAESAWLGGDVAGVRHHLELTDPAERGWEHDYLRRLTDDTVEIVHRFAAPPQGSGVSDDGRRLVTVADGTILLWDVDSGSLVNEIGPLEFAPPVALDGTGARVACRRGRDVVVLDAATGEPLGPGLSGLGAPPFALAFSRDGARVAAASARDTVAVWDLRRWAVELEMTGGSATRGLAFAPSGHRLAAADQRGTITLWDIDDGSIVAQRDGAGAYCVAFHPDGAVLAAGTTEAIALLDGETLAPLVTHPSPDTVRSVRFDRDGDTLLVATGDVLQLRNVRTALVQRTLQGHGAAAFTAAMASNTGPWCISVGGDGTLRRWHLGAPPVPRHVDGHDGGIEGAELSADGRRMVTAGRDGSIRRWALPAGTVEAPVDGGVGAIRTLAVDRSASRAVVSNAEGGTKLWDLDDRKLLAANATTAADLAFTHDGAHIVAAVDERVIRWRATDLTVTTEWVITAKALALAAHPSADQVAVVQADGGIALIDVASPASPEPLATLPGTPYCAAYAPDGASLAVGALDGSLRILDLPSGDERIHATQRQRIASLSFSPDGRRIATCGGGAASVVWDAASGQAVLSLRDDVSKTSARRILFTTGGELLVIALPDGRLWLHDAAAPGARVE